MSKWNSSVIPRNVPVPDEKVHTAVTSTESNVNRLPSPYNNTLQTHTDSIHVNVFCLAEYVPNRGHDIAYHIAHDNTGTILQRKQTHALILGP